MSFTGKEKCLFEIFLFAAVLLIDSRYLIFGVDQRLYRRIVNLFINCQTVVIFIRHLSQNYLVNFSAGVLFFPPLYCLLPFYCRLCNLFFSLISARNTLPRSPLSLLVYTFFLENQVYLCSRCESHFRTLSVKSTHLQQFFNIWLILYLCRFDVPNLSTNSCCANVDVKQVSVSFNQLYDVIFEYQYTIWLIFRMF